MDPEQHLQDRVDLTHAGEKEAQKFAPREDNYDATSEHAKGSSGEKAASAAANAVREGGSGEAGSHDNIAAAAAKGVQAATQGK